ncbi:MAG TPA: class I mannose-6-phosphate isomerase [Sphingopyxis sp.]|uniref:class I mannose-6-phosphate isomerase n=1 Tax=Sphingopyxis sp. TaxID=1908224 RepID=UPI002E16120E|nr:class I mannose-6-phosphate isomerase [Sphingopyxis sp.]
MTRKAQKLDTIRVEKPWGVDRLPPPFDARIDGRVGEIWFRPPKFNPLLVKYIFTSERLSIQVHPDDGQAQARGLPAGKEECWYILDAEPGAVLGIGTRRPLSERELADTARSGAIEALMEWHPVRANMFFHIPPGTVHAIGAGVSLVEIQQNVDVTYRLYDYGRPRELHLADGAAVARAAPMPGDLCREVDNAVSAILLDGRHLAVAHLRSDDLSLLAGVKEGAMIAPLDGTLAADGVTAHAGECLWVDDVATIAAEPGARFLAGWHKA